jgi:asparagine synthase (glutamine-hydrolysing)
MCGICGIFSKTSMNNPKLIHLMNDRLVHRGPDEEGFFVHERIAMGMRRLSIIDLKDGHQPIFCEQKRYVIVFNGEIYNFKELREDLINKGHRFATLSDTEVIVHLFEDKKDRCVEDLNGMFAFAIYDTVSKELFLARDRQGEKPLYYCFEDSMMMFASELKSICAVVKRKLELSWEAMDAFFSLTFIPSPLTIYRGIMKLEPGTCMTIKADLSYSIATYWDLGEKINRAEIIYSKKECMQKIREILYDSVTRRMISDVPLGAFLSGGVDSSIVVSIMAEVSRNPVLTFSIGNTVKAFDESDKAKTIAKRFGTDHTEWFVDNDHMSDILEKVIGNFDEPFADSSALPMYVVSELARKKATVALSGDGGDELFAGYSRYRIFRMLNLYGRIPFPLRNWILKPLVSVMPVPSSYVLLANKIKKLVANAGTDAFGRYHHMQRLGYSESEIGKLLNPEKMKSHITDFVRKKYCSLVHGGDLTRALYSDIAVGLEGDMLTKVDRASMLASLEVRTPFLDHRLIEFSFSIPEEYKLAGSRLKAILKDTFAYKFEKGFLDKPKMGFGIPIGELLRHELKGKMKSYLAMEQLADNRILQMNYVEKLYEEHCRGIDHTFMLWPFFVFSMWLDKNNNMISL